MFYNKIKRFILPMLKIGVTFFCFYVIANRIHSLKLSNFHIQIPLYLFFIFSLHFVSIFLYGVRWHFFLRSLGFKSCFKNDMLCSLAGNLLNNTLPTSMAGDVVRGLSLRFYHATNTQWMGALSIERFCAAITAFVLSVFAMIFFKENDVPSEIRFIILIFFVAAFLSSHIIRLFILISGKFIHRSITDFFLFVVNEISALHRRKYGQLTLLLSLIINMISALIFFFLSASLGNDLNVIQCFFIVPVLLIFSALPVSYGGWGVRELGGIHLLQYYGFSPEQALSMLLLFGLTIFLTSLSGIFGLKILLKNIK